MNSGMWYRVVASLAFASFCWPMQTAMGQSQDPPQKFGSGANMCEGRNKASGGVTTTRRVPRSKLQGQFGS